ncbi:MAG: hypothetical protein KatS3mg076_3211 [Candidatus Binatia bacterium]|nr:MAG: hypothetical protein KatS3mg076_3211 [Candidatus Binatia bacterium]
METPFRDLVAVPLGAVWNPLGALWAKLLGFLPNLLGAALILGVGYVLSTGARRLVTASLRRIGFDDASRRVGFRALLDRSGISATASDILGILVFWLVFLTFLLSAAEALALPNVSETIEALVRYVPNVIGAVLLVVVGVTVAHFLRDLVRSGTQSLGVEYARALSNVTYVVLLVLVASLAISQLRIEAGLLNRAVEIVLVASGAALALSLGLGSRDIAKHVIAGTYAREVLRPGVVLSAGEERGEVEQVGALFTCLRDESGRRVYIPNGRLTELVLHEEAGKP